MSFRMFMMYNLYHISEKNLNGVILHPRIPNNRFTREGKEDSITPRVSFSKSINGCIAGLGDHIDEGREFYVHTIDHSYSPYPIMKEITTKEVPDQDITDEVWVVNSVKLKFLFKIKITGSSVSHELSKVNKAKMIDYHYITENNIRGDYKMEKSQDFLLLEKCIMALKAKQEVNENLARITTILKRSFDLEFDISIVDNDTNQFFGMNIYPSRDTINAIVDAMLNEKQHTSVIVDLWQKNTKWFLEMDSILLYDKNLNANPTEIVAVMLHEIGHIVYSNSVPQRVNKIVRYQMMQADYAVKKLAQNWKIRKIFDLVIVEACGIKNFNYINTDKERIADQFVIKMGYGSELDQFIGKLIASQGNKLVNKHDSEIESDVKSIVNWSIENIAELEFRKKKLKSTIQTELLKNPSNFIKSVINSIKSAFFGEDSDDYRNLVTEQYLMDEYNTIVKESILDWFDSIGKVKKVNQSDLDFIGIEIDKIANNDDRIYVLDLIYDKFDLVNSALAYIEKGQSDRVQQSKQTLQGFKTQLDKMRERVVNMQIKDKQYGVFVKYPKGYEG